MKDRRTAHRIGIAQMVLCMIGLTAWALFSGCSLLAGPPSTSSWTLIFDGNGSDSGRVSVTKKYAAGAVLRLPDAGTLTKTGYAFTGWNTKANGSGTNYRAGESCTMGNFPVTFYAQWRTGSTITFDGNGSDSGRVPATKKYATGAVLRLPDAGTLAKTGLTFKSWNTEANGKGKDYYDTYYTMGTTPVTFYAQWAKGYAVTYDGNGFDGGRMPAVKKYVEDAVVRIAPEKPTKTGYTFMGWNSKVNGEGNPYPAGGYYTMGTVPLIFYAQWKKVYAVTYDGNGSDGGTVPQDHTKYAVGDVVGLPNAALAKAGHTFNGWNTKANGKGTSYQAGALYTMGTSPVTFYVQWAKKFYAITYDGNGLDGGTVPQDHKKYFESAFVRLPDTGRMTKAGHTFTGWNTKANGKGTSYRAGALYTMDDFPVTLYAQWGKVYAVTIDGNGSDSGTVPAAKQYAEGAKVMLPDVGTLTKTDLAFTGWNTKVNGEGKDYPAGASWTMGVFPVTFYAQWAPGYAVTFDGNGSESGTVPAAKQYAEGAKVMLPDAGTLTKTDLAFTGWNSKANGKGQDYQAKTLYTMGRSPVTFYAQWATIEYSVTFDGNGSDGGTVPAAKKYAHGAFVWLPDAGTLTKTDHIFNGWKRKVNGGRNPYPAGGLYIMGTSPVTFYAQWVRNK